jgi:hypothetical protein
MAMTTTIFYNQHQLTAQEIRQDEIRNAAITRNQDKATPKPFKFRDPGAPANDAQKGKIRAMLSALRGVDRATWEKASEWIDANIDDPNVFTMEMASKTIDRLRLRIDEATNEQSVMTTPPAYVAPAPVAYVRTPRDPFADVPDGYYAVTADEGHLAFYRVSTCKKSGDRKVQVQASSELHLIKGHQATDAILAKIRHDTATVAGKRYASELGNCYRCNRELTDETSRANGIGPICINKV